MKRWRCLVCLIVLLSLIPGLLWARDRLPPDTHALIGKKYAGWSGVLRLWICQDGAPSVGGWLNACIANYEKQHPGVYVQPEFVEAADIAAIGESGILPPDMVLFPPGMLETPARLLPLTPQSGLRAPLRHTGDWAGTTYAVPVALDGYIWALNTRLMPSLPDTWRGSEALLAVSEDRGAALLGLCAGSYIDDGESAPPIDPGLSLGLPESAAPQSTPEPGAPRLPCALPEGFQFNPDPWRAFINGEACATIVTASELRRLQALSAQGKGPDWKPAAAGAAFTDRVLSLGLVDKGTAETQALCAAFLDHLLSDACQGTLNRANAFSVTDSWSGYEGGDPLLTMEGALRGGDLLTPDVFGGAWRIDASEIVREFVAGALESPDAWRRLNDAAH